MIHFLRRHTTAAGLALTLALTWGALLPALLAARAAGHPVSASPLALTAAGCAPGTAALLLSALLEGRAGVLSLWRRIADWRAGWRWYALAYKGPTAAAFIALAVFHLFGGRFPPLSEWDAPILSTLLLVPLAGLGQEMGWRAFLLPRLQHRLGGLGASAVLGVGWGVWRLPFHFADAGARGAEVGWMLAGAIPMAVLFTWVWNRSGSRLLPMILLNASTQAVLTGLGALPNRELRPLMLWNAVLLVLAALVVWGEGARLGGPALAPRPAPSPEVKPASTPALAE
jgi:membrane protease YdiL (CAAX protease family)